MHVLRFPSLNVHYENTYFPNVLYQQSLSMGKLVLALYAFKLAIPCEPKGEKLHHMISASYVPGNLNISILLKFPHKTLPYLHLFLLKESILKING